jgi:hypothetical protein
MKDLIAKEFLYFFVALITAIPVAFFFVYLLTFNSEQSHMSPDEHVLEMDLLLIGGLLGFMGVYLIRLTMWAVKQVIAQ